MLSSNINPLLSYCVILPFAPCCLTQAVYYFTYVVLLAQSALFSLLKIPMLLLDCLLQGIMLMHHTYLPQLTVFGLDIHIQWIPDS